MIQKNERRAYASDLSGSQLATLSRCFREQETEANEKSMSWWMQCCALWTMAANGEICFTTFHHTQQWPIFITPLAAVHAANIHNTKSGILVARDAFEKYLSIQRFCADMRYRKIFAQDVSHELGLGADIPV